MIACSGVSLRTSPHTFVYLSTTGLQHLAYSFDGRYRTVDESLEATLLVLLCYCDILNKVCARGQLDRGASLDKFINPIIHSFLKFSLPHFS